MAKKCLQRQKAMFNAVQASHADPGSLVDADSPIWLFSRTEVWQLLGTTVAVSHCGFFV